jgi:hypothetical protein
MTLGITELRELGRLIEYRKEERSQSTQSLDFDKHN